MFDSISVRKIKNGFVVEIINSDGEQEEYCFDTLRRVMRFVKESLEGKNTPKE